MGAIDSQNCRPLSNLHTDREIRVKLCATLGDPMGDMVQHYGGGWPWLQSLS